MYAQGSTRSLMDSVSVRRFAPADKKSENRHTNYSTNLLTYSVSSLSHFLSLSRPSQDTITVAAARRQPAPAVAASGSRPRPSRVGAARTATAATATAEAPSPAHQRLVATIRRQAAIAAPALRPVHRARPVTRAASGATSWLAGRARLRTTFWRRYRRSARRPAR